ncbi:Hypothetical protein PHPALM_3257 [Phytophthora palmivora]|uniref:Uncharacterized protein n=1 Tax=Phytophthora palmivora TaxID=4796 RepID=A0A2P4YMV3_9STRA|nr:Hypothetical protein PHPALM_3257 [Phytophthora palmivora]
MTLCLFEFHYVSINHDNMNKTTRLMGWALPALTNLLRYNGTTLFVDGTFRCAPCGYKQCVIFMVHDRTSGVFVPVYYVLSTSRGEKLLRHRTDKQIRPAEVIGDFEGALQNAVETQFPNAIVVGCLFHMKQAVGRGMERFRIPEEERAIAMTRGVLDVFTVIEPAQVELGTRWVKREIRMRCMTAGILYSKAKWRGFGGNELIARTNNTLERSNRELNNHIPTHLSITTFVSAIKRLSHSQGQL